MHLGARVQPHRQNPRWAHATRQHLPTVFELFSIAAVHMPQGCLAQQISRENKWLCNALHSITQNNQPQALQLQQRHQRLAQLAQFSNSGVAPQGHTTNC